MFEYLKGIRSGLHLWVLIIYLFLSCAVPMGIHSSKPFKLLLNFDDLDRSGRWMVVNDGVMGGVSSSNLNLHSEGHLVFKGEVSMEYGGGFASIRTDYENWKIGKFKTYLEDRKPILEGFYGASKIAGESFVQAYCEAFDFKGWIFRFVSILGNRYTHGHVYDFCNQLFKYLFE